MIPLTEQEARRRKCFLQIREEGEGAPWCISSRCIAWIFNEGIDGKGPSTKGQCAALNRNRV